MIDTILASAKIKMGKAIDVVRTDLQSLRSGRATPALVENISILAYGGAERLKLMEMATITSVDGRGLVITPFDPSAIDDIVKGISEARIGMNPVRDGEVVRITLPPLSEEQRKEYLKLANWKLEGGKIMVRQVRQDAMKELKRDLEAKLLSEDEEKVGEKKIQEMTDQMIHEIEEMGKRKEEELMQV
jgi:ribosome recycling factor